MTPYKAHVFGPPRAANQPTSLMPNPSQATLGEGNTPLVSSVSMGPKLGLKNLYFKLENCNPTGSYKDRFIAAEVTRLVERGVKACVATSSGNTGASLASYCARYGIVCSIVVSPETPAGKLEQMRVHGARLLQVKGFISSSEVTETVMQTLERLSGERNMPLVVSAFRYCPEGMAGVQSIAPELSEQCDGELDHVFVPVGGGGLFTAVCRGFDEVPGAAPKVHVVQPQGCPTVVEAFERGVDTVQPVESTTKISGLSVPFDADATTALKALRANGGQAFGVEDAEVYEAQRMMLSEEGIYCEPAAATALAGLRRAVGKEIVGRDDRIVCLVTGHGFKDPESIARAAAEYPPVLLEAGELESCLTA
jgi:threonine synthase